jgi:hypothetical protein
MTNMADGRDSRSGARDGRRGTGGRQENRTQPEEERTSHMSLLKHIRRSSDNHARHGAAGIWAGSRRSGQDSEGKDMSDKTDLEMLAAKRLMRRAGSNSSKQDLATKTLKPAKAVNQPDTY